MALILNSVPLIPLLFNVAFVSFSKGLMNTDSANKTNRSGETSNAEGSKGQIISEYFFYQQKFSTNFCPKGGFFSESEIRFSISQSPKKKFPKKANFVSQIFCFLCTSIMSVNKFIHLLCHLNLDWFHLTRINP